MPVRGHEAVAQDPDGVAFQGLVQHPQESRVIGGFAKQLQPARGPVERMVNIAGGRLTCTAWHGRSLIGGAGRVKKNRYVPFVLIAPFFLPAWHGRRLTGGAGRLKKKYIRPWYVGFILKN